MTEKLFGALSLCRKAGKLTMGGDVCEEAVRTHKAALIVLTNDLSPRSKKRMHKVCAECHVPLITVANDMEELAPYVGKEYGIFAICDRGFGKMIGDVAVKAESGLDIEH